MHRSVVDTRYGLSASERRVGSVMIIGGEEPVERSGASVVGLARRARMPSPQAECGRTVRPCRWSGACGGGPHVLHAHVRQGVTEHDGLDLGERVVGHHGSDVDAVRG